MKHQVRTLTCGVALLAAIIAAGCGGKQTMASKSAAAYDEAKKKGHRTLWLGVWEHNARARAFYSKWSFREVGEHIFQLGADSQTDILMERQVEQ